MELLENTYSLLSPANQKRYIKGRITDILKSQGFEVRVTDTPVLTFITDKPINEKSKLLPQMLSDRELFVTSLGKQEALRMIEENKS